MLLNKHLKTRQLIKKIIYNELQQYKLQILRLEEQLRNVKLQQYNDSFIISELKNKNNK